MKTLIASLVLVASSTTFACPDLTGNFKCSSQNGFSFTGNFEKMDGNRYKLEEGPVVEASEDGFLQSSEGMGFKIETVGTCRGDEVLEVKSTTTNAESGAFLGHVIKTYNLQANRNIDIWIVTGTDRTAPATRIECVRQYK